VGLQSIWILDFHFQLAKQFPKSSQVHLLIGLKQWKQIDQSMQPMEYQMFLVVPDSKEELEQLQELLTL
jgi:hypothetical protein